VVILVGLILFVIAVPSYRLVKSVKNYRLVRRRWQDAEQSQAMYFAACRLVHLDQPHAQAQEQILALTNGSPEQADAAIASAKARWRAPITS
jgi:phage-related baseplate assembly protein